MALTVRTCRRVPSHGQNHIMMMAWLGGVASGLAGGDRVKGRAMTPAKLAGSAIARTNLLRQQEDVAKEAMEGCCVLLGRT